MTIATLVSPITSNGNMPIEIKSPSGNTAEINALGELKVISALPSPPPATTPVNLSFVDVSSATLDEIYIITSGQTLTIQQVRSGAAGNGAICSAYIADDGVNPNDLTNPITTAYNLPGNNTQLPATEVLGDGTRAIILRREPQGGGGTRSMYIALSGFETA